MIKSNKEEDDGNIQVGLKGSEEAKEKMESFLNLTLPGMNQTLLYKMIYDPLNNSTVSNNFKESQYKSKGDQTELILSTRTSSKVVSVTVAVGSAVSVAARFSSFFNVISLFQIIDLI